MSNVLLAIGNDGLFPIDNARERLRRVVIDDEIPTVELGIDDARTRTRRVICTVSSYFHPTLDKRKALGIIAIGMAAAHRTAFGYRTAGIAV